MGFRFKRILLSGGSGMIGGALALELQKGGVDAIKLSRRPVSPASAEVYWSPESAEAVAEPDRLEGLDAAVHLSGANVAEKRWTPEYKREIFESRIQTTHALVHSLSRLKQPPEVLVVASAVGIYGDRGDEVLTEHSAPGRGFLAETCCAWEAAANRGRESGMRVVHLRFGVVLSPQGGALGKVLPLFRYGLGARLGDGRQWVSWITLGDAVRAIVRAIESERLEGAINVVSPNPMTNAAYTRALGDALHRPAFAFVPGFALRAMAGEMADEALLASARAIPEKLVADGFQFEHRELAPALDALLQGR